MDNNQLHLSQYNQVWEQRRQHVTLFWSIPVTAAIVSYLGSTVDFSKVSAASKMTALTLLLVFFFGILLMSLRHAFIQKAYSLLLQDLEDRLRNSLAPLPQTAGELSDLYQESAKLGFWERMGAKCPVMWSWILMITSIIAFIFVLWFDLEGKNILKF